MMAEKGGFEPPIPLRVYRISSAAHSTALPLLLNTRVVGELHIGLDGCFQDLKSGLRLIQPCLQGFYQAFLKGLVDEFLAFLRLDIKDVDHA